VSPTPKKDSPIKLMHWSIMTDKRAQTEYKGKLPDKVLAIKQRQWLILNQIKAVDPDIFDLCEIERDSLAGEICKLGYGEYSKNRDQVPVSIFYKKSRFDLVESKFYCYLTELKKGEPKAEKAKDSKISPNKDGQKRPSSRESTERSITSNPPSKDTLEWFICTHLKLKADPKKELFYVATYLKDQADFRILQLNKFFKRKMDTQPNLPIIVSGVLGLSPKSAAIEKLEESFIDLHGLKVSDQEPTAIGQTWRYPAYTKQSAEEGIHMSTVDYMFIAKRFTLDLDTDRAEAAKKMKMSIGQYLLSLISSPDKKKDPAASSQGSSQLKLEVL
jgi:hypothetical protein